MMKKILVPVDFSDISKNALVYAIELAKRTNADLFLLHAYTQPVFATEPMMSMPPIPDMEKIGNENMNELKKFALKIDPNITINTYCIPGVPITEIKDFLKNEPIDLIVIGAQGKGYLEERIMGSTVSSLIQNTDLPVLVIDKHVRFREPKKIVLASDFIQTSNRLVLHPLMKLINLFNAELTILNVYRNDTVVPTMSEIVASFELDQTLKRIHHTFVYVNATEVVVGINDFVKEKKMDMVVMIARQHSIFDRIFREPYTKKMAFHSTVPFLALHE